MAGIGQLAIAVFLIAGLGIFTVAALSSAQQDKPTDDTICNGSCNSSAQIAEMVGTQGANLMVPVVAISGILLLGAVFAFLKRSGR